MRVAARSVSAIIIYTFIGDKCYAMELMKTLMTAFKEKSATEKLLDVADAEEAVRAGADSAAATTRIANSNSAKQKANALTDSTCSIFGQVCAHAKLVEQVGSKAHDDLELKHELDSIDFNSPEFAESMRRVEDLRAYNNQNRGYKIEDTSLNIVSSGSGVLSLLSDIVEVGVDLFSQDENQEDPSRNTARPLGQATQAPTQEQPSPQDQLGYNPNASVSCPGADEFLKQLPSASLAEGSLLWNAESVKTEPPGNNSISPTELEQIFYITKSRSPKDILESVDSIKDMPANNKCGKIKYAYDVHVAGVSISCNIGGYSGNFETDILSTGEGYFIMKNYTNFGGAESVIETKFRLCR